MRLNKFPASILALLLLTLICSGCETLPDIIKVLPIDEDWKPIVDAFAKVVADAANARQLRDAQETNSSHEYTPDKGLTIVIETVNANPSVQVPGGSIAFSMVYAIMGAGADGITLQETRTLRQNGKILKDIEPTTFVRTDGTWESTQEFTFPPNTPAGSYEMVQTVSAANIQVQKITIFAIAETDS